MRHVSGQPVDTGNPQFVERALLDAIDKPDPHLAGLSHTEGNIQDRPNLIAADHRIEQRLAQHRVLRVALVDHHPGRRLAHLPDLLFEGHLLEQLPDAGFYLFIGRYGRGYLGTCGQSAQQAQKQNRNFLHSTDIHFLTYFTFMPFRSRPSAVPAHRKPIQSAVRRSIYLSLIHI